MDLKTSKPKIGNLKTKKNSAAKPLPTDRVKQGLEDETRQSTNNSAR